MRSPSPLLPLRVPPSPRPPVPASPRLPVSASTASILSTLSILLALALPSPAAANGGVVQVAGKLAGPYALTVFTSPSPIRVGEVDVSVLVQRAGGSEVVSDARVQVAVAPLGHDAPAVAYPATHELATNKLYYAAHVTLTAEGRWSIRVHVAGPEGEGSVAFEVDATPATPLDNPLLLVALLAAPLLAIAGWWLSSARRSSTPH